MRDFDEDMAEYSGRHDAFREAREANVAFLGGIQLHFHIAIDPSRVVGPLYEAQPTATERDIRRLYADTVESALAAPDGPAGPVFSSAEPWGGPKTGGPIPDQTYLVELIGLTLGGMATVVLLSDFASVVHRILKKAREKTHNEVAVSDGLAVILAAEALRTADGVDDLTLAFVTPMNKHLSGLDEMESSSDGWLVGFRSRSTIKLAHVDRHGRVAVPDNTISVDWEAR